MMNSLSTIIFVYILLHDLFYNTYLCISHAHSLSLSLHSLMTLILIPHSFWGEQWCSSHEALSHFMMTTAQETCTTWWSAWKNSNHRRRNIFWLTVGECSRSWEWSPSRETWDHCQITSLVIKHREMKRSSLLAFFLSPTLCPRYMKRCSFQLKCVVLPQFTSRKSLTDIQMFVSRSCQVEI